MNEFVTSTANVAARKRKARRKRAAKRGVGLAPGNRAIDMVIDAYREREGIARNVPIEHHPEPQIDEPYDEIANYREPPRKVVAPKLSVWQRIKNWWKK